MLGCFIINRGLKKKTGGESKEDKNKTSKDTAVPDCFDCGKKERGKTEIWF